RDSPPADARPMHAAVARALLLLRENGAEMSLSELAREAGTTAPYLSRLLIEFTGRSFVDWRSRIRLDRFMAAWRPGNNLLDAALAAGFGSYARFHHIFSQMIGCAPGEWARRSERGDSAAATTALPDFGIPTATMLSARQRWGRLLPLLAPNLIPVVGEAFL